MKNVYALLIALVLGAAGALLNWSYLHRRSQDIEQVLFVGLARDVSLEPGDTFGANDLAPVPVPNNRVGNLADFAYTWDLRNSVIGMPVNRRYLGGELVMQSDVKTPSEGGRPLKKDEEFMLGVPVDTRTFVPSWFKAGDWVSFLVPKGPPSVLPGGSAAASNSATEMIGKFEVWAVGDRTSSSKVARAANQPHSQQNVLQIVVKRDGDGLEKNASRLADLIAGGTRNIMVIKHPEVR